MLIINTFLIAVLLLLSNPLFAQAENPILPGFYPDPSICRAGDDYYLVNSSFSYFPGVPIFHSQDLVHWRQIGHVLDRPSQLNLTNQWMSAGIYAPSIRYHKGLFYMITTFVKGGGNFYVTAEDPSGPWSDPFWLKDVDGIDPSFFFDDDGKTYIVNNGPVADGNPQYPGHRSLWLQEFDFDSKSLIGKRVEIVNGGTDISQKPIWIEGPHIFNHKGYYYLLCAEGGTRDNHAEVIFRSKSIFGPYVSYEGNPILTQKDMPADRLHPVTSTGHADFVQTPQGDWVSVYLGCQPYAPSYFNTGRQTFIQSVDWSGEWPVILEKGKAVPYQVDLPLPVHKKGETFRAYSADWEDNFEDEKLKFDWNYIRTPQSKWDKIENGILTLEARPVSISQGSNPSFIGRRQQHDKAEFSTSLYLKEGQDVEAGIVYFQNEKNYYSLLLNRTNGRYSLLLSNAEEVLATIVLDDTFDPSKPLKVMMKVDADKLSCYYTSKRKWQLIGQMLDAKYLSTQIARGYIGAYFGLYAFAESPVSVDFVWARYKRVD